VDSVINEFNDHVKEVDLYFSFLEETCKYDTKLYFENKQSHKYKNIDMDLERILKANSFILLYNLVESSFRSTLENLSDAINNSGLTYGKAIPEISKIWLQYQRKLFANSKDYPTGQSKVDFMYSEINQITDQVLNLPKELKGNDISGNLDPDNIKQFAALYGIESETFEGKRPSELFKVTSLRNKLAHGNESFLECVRQYSFNDLEKMKKEVVTYMKFILNLFKTKIDNKYYSTG